MCFGGMEETGKTSTTTTTELPGWLTKASKWNVNNTLDMAKKPYEAFGGERVAPFSNDQLTSFDMIRDLAGKENPYLADIERLFKTYADTPATQVNTPSILGGNTDVRTASISDYMNPYIAEVLAPQLREIERNGAMARNRNAAAATMEGAFGDARHGVVDSSQIRDENQLLTDTTGKAYAAAFDSAGNLRTRDVANLMDTDKTNATLTEEALKRAITGGTSLRDLDKYMMGRDLDLAKSLQTSGAAQQKYGQDKANAEYEAYLREQGWGGEMAKLLASITGSAKHNTTTNATSTTMAPDNSGFQMLGSLAGAALAPMTGGASLLGSLGSFGPALGLGTGATHTPGSYSSAFPMPL
jgi:hypothetical protein